MSHFDSDSFSALDLSALEAASGGVAMYESLRGLDVQGSGYWGIDSYDNGATTYWSGPQNGVTELPFDYFGFGY